MNLNNTYYSKMKIDAPYTGPTYTKIPNKAFELLAELNLPAATILVYFALCKHYNYDKNQSWPSLNTISKTTGLGLTSTKRSLNILCLKGMILRSKIRSMGGDYESNIYLIPHCVKYQIEYLLEDKKNLKKNKAIINHLQILDTEISNMINEQTRRSKNDLPRSKSDLPRTHLDLGESKKGVGGSKNADGVGLNTSTNNTIINKTNNITINVAKDNDQLPNELTQIKKHKRSMSLSSPQHIGEISSLVNLKNEGLAQEIAGALNDHKSLPFFRSVVSKLSNHEDIIHKCLSLTRETAEITGIKKTKGAVFTDHIKREGIKLGIEI
jgi:hypothetical protein